MSVSSRRGGSKRRDVEDLALRGGVQGINVGLRLGESDPGTASESIAYELIVSSKQLASPTQQLRFEKRRARVTG